MRNLSGKVVMTILAAGFGSCVMLAPVCSAAEDVNGNDNNGVVNITGGEYGSVSGWEISNVGNPTTDNKEYANGKVTIKGITITGGNIAGISAWVDKDSEAKFSNNSLEISGENVNFTGDGQVYFYGACVNNNNIYPNDTAVASGNSVKLSNLKITQDAKLAGIYGAQCPNAKKNLVEITNSEIAVVKYGYGILGGRNGLNNGGTTEINGNRVVISSSVIDAKNGYGVVGGANFGNEGSANGNTVEIIDSTVKGKVIGGWNFTGAEGVETKDNSIIIRGKSNIEEVDLYATSRDMIADGNNTLTLDNWSGSVKDVIGFNAINFQNLKWEKDGAVLNITEAVNNNLKDTQINLESINMAGGQKLQENDSMNIIQSSAVTGLTRDNINIGDAFSAGVALVGKGEASVDDNGNVKYTITELTANKQIDLVAENRAVAAAFLNQGNDLIADTLDTLAQDSGYGVKTFAAVYGNRSEYDVNSDLKINGWSSIVGVGNAKDLAKAQLLWGVFYENGSGNYRTYNNFNEDFFRGDGSLVYNGGGVAMRYQQHNGVYAEGSLRAGMLKSEMSNALRDGGGNSYGYKSESDYYGGHLGIGKVITLDEAKSVDVYGKYFHVYTDGDSFNVAGDCFEFDEVQSDRVQIGARLRTNKNNKFSAYYGLAWEYEFNGEADMKAQGMTAPAQSLKGSSCMGEIGVNYVPSLDSPWSFDAKLRAYAGQREGFSGNVQAVYSF